MTAYHDLLARAVGALPDSAGEARGAIYRRAREALFNQLREMQPPLSQERIVAECRLLEDAIARIEAEAAGAAAPVLAAHRAAYRLELAKTSGPGAPAAASGSIVFEFSGSPGKGFSHDLRQKTALRYAGGETRESEMRATTFESPGSEDYRFKIETFTGGEPAEIAAGAVRRADEDILAVELAQPEASDVGLAGPAVFPTEYVRRLIAAARAGETRLETKLYDGTYDAAKLFDTAAVIGGPIASPAPEQAAQIGALKKLTRWPVTTRYYAPGDAARTPIYAFSCELYENGVARAVELDHGDFVLAGALTELTLA